MGFWNKLKAQWYKKGLKHSNFHKAALPLMLERTNGAKTYLDVGAGCGALSIPLAKAGKRVTALEPADSMYSMLVEEIRAEKLEKRITAVHMPWIAEKIKKHDVVFCANVPELLKDPVPFALEASQKARKAVFLIVNADPSGDKFYYKELYPLLFKKEFQRQGNYLSTYSALYDSGISANVEMIEYDFDQPFDSMNDALEFWKEYLGIVTAEHDAALEKFLKARLVKKRSTLLAKFHKKSAVIWWRTKR